MNIFFIPFIFFYWEQVLFTLRVSSLLSPLNDASGGIADDESFFSFLLKLNSHHPCNRHWSRINVLRTTATVLKTCWSPPLAFKWLLNELLLETKWSEVMLIWWFVSIKFIRPFLKFSFLICFFKRFPL